MDMNLEKTPGDSEEQEACVLSSWGHKMTQ